ncbi:ralA-binding protein 1 [Vespula squamosa]|uniref:RalA-binding protein 1 n=1 Tax=Vespula squamosa TaxID=30214 RepID=A0ABD2AC14_VESSQ
MGRTNGGPSLSLRRIVVHTNCDTQTYCHTRNSLSSLCSYITGDALLYSMFREEALPVPCPFRGPMTFSYNRGHGTCSIPQSNVDTCTDDSRLLFRYQACPDVSASESADSSNHPFTLP